MALFWIRIGNLGEFLLQTVQNDVQEETTIKLCSWRQHDDSDNSDAGETPSKHDSLCTDQLVGRVGHLASAPTHIADLSMLEDSS
jgi:hypothetical protein